MTDDKKSDGEVKEQKQPASQPSSQQNSPAGKEASTKSAVESEKEHPKEAAPPSPVERSTEKLRVGDMAGLPDSLLQTYRGDTGTAKYFRRLPVSMSTAELPPETPRWQVELIGLGSTIEPVGLEIVGDTVVGRGRVGTEPADLDLDMYGALEKGVSRRHGLLRPTTNHLYIIDLGSTNGTFHNGIPLGPGVARALKHNDTITLGRFSFTIKLIDGPTMRRTIEVGKSTGASRPDETDKTKPLEPLDPSTVKEKKARLAPPAFEPASPETSNLPEGEEAKSQPQLSTAEKPLPQKAKSPIPDVRSLVEGGTPQASPTPEAKEPDKGAKPSKPDEKKSEEKVETPVAEIVKSEKMTKPLDPETRPMKATPPTSEAKPAVVDNEPPAKNTEAAKEEAKLPVSGKPSTSEEPEKKPTKKKDEKSKSN